jgi:Zn-dependent peptidase ImmA (M78 family)
MEHLLKSQAIEFRNLYGYNSSEPVNLISLLQRIDILAVFKPLSEDFSGLSIKIDKNNFILINSNQSVGRQNFTICHEIYHLFYDQDFVPHKCKTGLFPTKNNSERYADIFASNLLLPEEGIIRLIPVDEMDRDKIRLATILKIEQTFGSSRLALLNQLLKMKLISRDFGSQFSAGIKRGAKQHGYSVDLYEPNQDKMILGVYGSLANQLFDDGKISEGHYRELLMAIGVDINELNADEED